MTGNRADLPQPLGGNEMPRFGGPATMMRLEAFDSPEGLDAAFLGVPLDIGTSNRSGTRYGPKAVRAESALLRPFNLETGAAPFNHLRVGDIGDVATNPYDLTKSIDAVEARVADCLRAGCKPMVIGGDHTLTLGVLRAIAGEYGAVSLLHVDAHADVNDEMFGEPLAHGTWVRRAVEENLVLPDRVMQIGLRGTGYSPDDFDWGRDLGFSVVTAKQIMHRPLAPILDDLAPSWGDQPLYVSFDIDSLGPAFAPGTGTPEIGGLTTWQALELIRSLKGLNIIGFDLVEVSPPYDLSGNTALVGANILYELLCVLPGHAAPTNTATERSI